ncbi:MAG TPA: SpoVG family protein [Clostridiales bacterium]|jgi:stage V sporulation protein G|nr:SpoVG family protein [Clostridiales bacterium]
MAKSQTPSATPRKADPAEARTPLPVEFDVRIQSLQFSGSTRATATVDINGAFAVRGVKVMEGSKGLFVSLPGYKAGNGEYKDICFPCTKESRMQFDSAVLGAYDQALHQAQAQSQKSAPSVSQQAQSTAPKMSM